MFKDLTLIETLTILPIVILIICHGHLSRNRSSRKSSPRPSADRAFLQQASVHVAELTKGATIISYNQDKN